MEEAKTKKEKSEPSLKNMEESFQNFMSVSPINLNQYVTH